MKEKTDCDVIVIGAGLAGLSCAAHLAKAGERVVVLEQHCRPGGLWASFSRRGAIFDLSTHWVTDPQTLNRMLEELGSSPVNFVHLEHLGRYVGPPAVPGSAGTAGTPPAPRTAAAAPSWDILVGPDVEAFKESVRASFPAVAEKSLARLVSMAIGVSRLLDSLAVYSGELASIWARAGANLSLLTRIPKLSRLGRMPAEQLLERLFPGDELTGLRAALYTLAPIPGMPAIGQLAILGIGLRGKLYSPRGGSQVLADAFAQAAVSNGAEIRYSQSVVSVLTDRKQVRGVALADGSELRAPSVVSAGDARRTFSRLLGSHRVPESYQKLLDAQPVSEPYALISLVTTLDPATVGFDGTDVFVCPSVDVPHALESKEPEDCAFLLVFPQYAEPGTDRTLRPLQIVVPAGVAWREHWQTSPTPERGPAYRALKEEFANIIISRVQEYIPRLSSHLEVVDVSTPISFYRYTMNSEGAPVGWHYRSRRRWKQRVPFLHGLYQAGHWVGPSGALAVTRSGKWAAQLVLKDTAKRA